MESSLYRSIDPGLLANQGLALIVMSLVYSHDDSFREGDVLASGVSKSFHECTYFFRRKVI